jgi:hypothetical protein
MTSEQSRCAAGPRSTRYPFRYALYAFLDLRQFLRTMHILATPRERRAAPPIMLADWIGSILEALSKRRIAPATKKTSAENKPKKRIALSGIAFVVQVGRAEGISFDWF